MSAIDKWVTNPVWHRDDRGEMAIYDPLPFKPARAFTITAVPRSEVRGKHAHRTCEQYVICATGWFQMKLRRPWERNATLLKLLTGEAVHVPPMTWIELLEFSTNGTAVVLASHGYDEADIITDKKKFNATARKRPSTT